MHSVAVWLHKHLSFYLHDNIETVGVTSLLGHQTIIGRFCFMPVLSCLALIPDALDF